MNNGEQRGPWYLITGLVIGVVLGLVYAWRVSPVQYVDTSPASLRSDYKDSYRALIAAAYLAHPDLARAEARLKLLGDQNAAQALTIQAQQAVAENRPQAEARALGMLAVSIVQGAALPAQSTSQPDVTAQLSFTSTSTLAPTVTFTPSPSASPTSQYTDIPSPTPGSTQQPAGQSSSMPATTVIPATQTPFPTHTPSPTPGAPFVLQDKKFICDSTIGKPLIMVEVVNATNQPIAGAEVVVNWSSGEDHFFTGLKPEIDLGYADFLMTLGETYTVHVGDGGQPVSDLTANNCSPDKPDAYPGVWKLRFTLP